MKKMNMLVIVLAMALAGQCYGETDTADPKPAGQSWQTEDFQNIWTRPKLTGDWYGLRSDLAEKGITFDLRLSQFYQAVTSGGANTNAAYGGKLDYILKLDGQKLGLWEGLFVTVHTETQFGNNISADAGDLALPNTAMLWPVPGYRGTAVTGFLVEQALSENFALLGGKINVLDLWTMVYPHTGAGQEGFMNTNMIASALPWFRWVNLSVMGGGALFLTDDGQVQGGVVAFDSQNSSTTSGFDDMFEEGTCVVGLWRFFFEVGGKPGSLLFAGGTSTRNYDSLDESDWGFSPGVGLTNDEKNGAWTTAFYYDQVFWQAPDNAKKNMRFFTGWSLSDGDPSFGRWGGFGSVEGWGMIQDRAKDRMGVGAFYNQLSSDLKNTTSDLGLELRNMWGGELYYNAEITPSLHVTPNLQLVSNATDGDSTAVILGVRAVMDF